MAKLCMGSHLEALPPVPVMASAKGGSGAALRSWVSITEDGRLASNLTADLRPLMRAKASVYQ